MPDLRDQFVALIRERALQYRPEPFRLTSGEWSHDYIDGKQAIRDGAGLRLAAQAIAGIADRRGVVFDTVGGLTMGSDPLAHAVAMHMDVEWFSVRKEPKGHGKQRLIEGAELTPQTRVLLVDDVVTTGLSIFKALDAVQETGAAVVLAVTLVDRGRVAARRFAERGIAYEPLATFADLGIEAVGPDTDEASTG